jgi:hypothetical protein
MMYKGGYLLMVRPAVLLVFAFALQGVPSPAQSSGTGASILSPSTIGAGHAVPSSVNSTTVTQGGPVVPFFSRNSHPVAFGNPHRRPHPRNFVPVPIFIPAYPLPIDNSFVQSDQPAEDQQEQPEQEAATNAGGDSSGSDDSLRQAYIQGAHDALAAARQRGDSRYGDHYFDSRENQPAPAPSSSGKAKAATPQDDPVAGADHPDNSPATVFIFKDGHKIETQNYAIQGQTLFDFSNNHLTKVKLAELDLDATRKANDDLGITVKLPSTP